MTRKPREARPTTSGWKAQSIAIMKHLTGPTSKAREQGLMPGYAEQAYAIAVAAGKVAGMAKKRWRDASPARMGIRDVQRLRREVDDAFTELERIVLSDATGHTGVRNRAAAEESFRTHGMVGHLGLALMEEAAELAEPLHAIATGRATIEAEKQEVRSESADLRTYLHLVDTAFQTDPVATTQAKWEVFLSRMPEEVRAALNPVRLSDEQIRQSFAAMAAVTLEKKK